MKITIDNLNKTINKNRRNKILKRIDGRTEN